MLGRGSRWTSAAGYLRVATTAKPAPWTPTGGEQAHPETASELGASGDAPRRAGWVGGLGRGEQIRAVRFLGDRGYVVTYRRTDPLYTSTSPTPPPRVAAS